ncbi:uncharacterized protein LOC131613384 [Vicia villosa]|uniref:uncharacterized protein LOC131613384 n=1 Tax=Vicia villosa TaxID=3911 RepID=UPI00273C6D0D|nr:uncharacterized protein LOC131613384 [Vicia villosa]
MVFKVTTTIVPFADTISTSPSKTQKNLSMEKPPTKRRTTTTRQKSTMKTGDSSRPKPSTPTRRSARHATTSHDSTPSEANPEKSQNPNPPPSSTQIESVPQPTKPSSSHVSTQSSEGNSLVSSSFQAYDHPSEVSTKEFISNDDVRSLYNDKWRSLPIVAGKTVNLDSYSIWGYDLNELAKATGWTNFLKLSDVFYPRLVRTFFASIEPSKSDTQLISSVKGQQITLTPELLCEILHVPNNGLHLFNDEWPSSYDLDIESYRLSITKHPAERFVSANLESLSHIIHDFYIHTILPRKGSMERVTDKDLLVIYHFSKKIPLNIGYLVLNYLKHTGLRARSAPYGMLLTKIFKHFNVPLDDEDSFEINKILDASKLRRMKIPSLKRAPSPKPETKSKRRRLVKQYAPTEPLTTGIDSPNSPNSLTTNSPIPLFVALPNTADLESPQKSSPTSPHAFKSVSPNPKETDKQSPETTQCIDLTSTSPILVESSPQTVVISQAPVSLQTKTISNVEIPSTLETSDTDMINIFALENLLSSPPAASAHQPPSPKSPYTPASNPDPDAQLSSLISMLEAELLTPPASNQQTSIIPHVVTYTSPSMTIVPVSTISPLNSLESYKEPSPPRVQLTSINHTDSDDLTAQIEAFFNNPIQPPEQTSLIETHTMPSIPQSDPYAFQTNSPIFSSPKEDDDNSFNVQNILAPRYDSSPPRNTTNNSNTLPQHPIVSITSSFFNNFPSIGNRPPVYPRTTTSSDMVNPHQGVSLRSLTALQKQLMAYQKFWIEYVTEQVCLRFPGMLPPDPSQIQFPILPLSSEATSDDEPSGS